MADEDFGPWSVEPTLQPGLKNDPKVEQLQQLLQVHINPGLEVDGDFGPGTETAVKALQERHGLPQTGIVDAATWRVLLEHPTSQGGGMVVGQKLFADAEERYHAADYAGAIEKFQAALAAGDEVGALSPEARSSIVANVATAYARLGDGAQCAAWASHAIEIDGIDAARRCFQLHYYASTGRLGSLDFSALKND